MESILWTDGRTDSERTDRQTQARFLKRWENASQEKVFWSRPRYPCPWCSSQFGYCFFPFYIFYLLFFFFFLLFTFPEDGARLDEDKERETGTNNSKFESSMAITNHFYHHIACKNVIIAQHPYKYNHRRNFHHYPRTSFSTWARWIIDWFVGGYS